MPCYLNGASMNNTYLVNRDRRCIYSYNIRHANSVAVMGKINDSSYFNELLEIIYSNIALEIYLSISHINNSN